MRTQPALPNKEFISQSRSELDCSLCYVIMFVLLCCGLAVAKLPCSRISCEAGFDNNAVWTALLCYVFMFLAQLRT